MLILYAALKYDYGNSALGYGFEHYNFFDSLMRTDLLMEASNDQEPGSSIPARPSEPRVPGLGFCSRICPFWALLTAWSVQ